MYISISLTLTLTEYRTIWSTVETFKWRTLSLRFWKLATIFKSCLGRFFVSILMLAWLSAMFTSMSPTFSVILESWSGAELLLWLARVEYCGKVKKSANGDETPLSPAFNNWLVFLFCASMDCNSCSSSLTKLMEPPITDAWSPCRHDKIICI